MGAKIILVNEEIIMSVVEKAYLGVVLASAGAFMVTILFVAIEDAVRGRHTH
jgi:hypothetical protein